MAFSRQIPQNSQTFIQTPRAPLILAADPSEVILYGIFPPNPQAVTLDEPLCFGFM